MRLLTIAALAYSLACAHVPKGAANCETTCGAHYWGNATCDTVQGWEDRALLGIDAWEVPRLIIVSHRSVPIDNGGRIQTYLMLGPAWTYDEVCASMLGVTIEFTGEAYCGWAGDKIELSQNNYASYAVQLAASLDLCFGPEDARWEERRMMEALLNPNGPPPEFDL